MKRWLLIGGGVVAVLVLVVVGVLVFVVANLDSVIKAGVERFGPEVTQTDVRLDDVEVSARSGRGALRGLFVGSPAGFEAPSMFELGEVSLDIDVASLTSDTIVVREIVVDAPQITYELGPDGSNIDALRRNVEQAVGNGGSGDGAAGGGSGSQGDSDGVRKIIIENLYVRGGQIGVAATALPGQTLQATLPDIHLTDLGKDRGGADPAVLVDQIVTAVTEQIVVAVAGVDLEGLLEGATGQAKEQLQGVLEDAAGEGAGRALQELEGAGERLKGVLRGN